jgi:hypothetical protein
MQTIFFVIISCILTFWSYSTAQGQEYLEKGRYKLHRSAYETGLVGGMNVLSFAEKHLSEFTFSERETTLYRGIIHYFYRKSDNAKIQLIVGLYPTVEIAEEMMLELLNTNTLAFEYSPVMGHQIGDNCWWLNNSPSPLRYVLFIRKNMVVQINDISSDNRYQQLLELALSLDGEIMEGSQYIPLKDELTPPQINSVLLTKNQLSLNESALATVIASEPLQKNLIYRCTGRAYNDHDGLENTFKITSSKNVLPGIYSLKFWVVNEDNAYSDIHEVKVTF